jgi:hypothetical protein
MWIKELPYGLMLSGAIIDGFIDSGLLFPSRWKDSRDLFFLAVSLLIEDVNRACAGVCNNPNEDRHPSILFDSSPFS